jgi:hypothetical protein
MSNGLWRFRKESVYAVTTRLKLCARGKEHLACELEKNIYGVIYTLRALSKDRRALQVHEKSIISY